MVPSDFDQECFELYCKYQTQIHLDSPDKLSVEGYRRFLVDSPIFVISNDFIIERAIAGIISWYSDLWKLSSKVLYG